MNNSGPTAQIVERDGWKTNMDFVGHRKAVTVVVSSSRAHTRSPCGRSHFHPHTYVSVLFPPCVPLEIQPKDLQEEAEEWQLAEAQLSVLLLRRRQQRPIALRLGECPGFDGRGSCSARALTDILLSVSLPSQLTSLKRPLVVIHDLFDKSIMDISW